MLRCPQIPTVSIATYRNRLLTNSQGRNIPLSGSIEITAQCNLDCVHCYLVRSVKAEKSFGHELTQEELFRIIDEIVEEGCLWLLITGGEPLLRTDFESLYIYAKKKGLLVTLFTNATLVTPRIADMLAEWLPSSLEVTLYGRTQATYEAVTGVPGSYERCISGIESLVNRCLPLQLKTVISKLNCHELAEMRKYAQELGAGFRFDPVLIPRMDGNASPAAFRISPEQVVELDLADEKRVKELHEFAEQFSGPPPESDLLYFCGAGVSTFHIDAWGRLSPCLTSRQQSFNLRSGTFREGWLEFMPRALGQKRTRKTVCRECKLLALCGLCPALAALESGDDEAVVDYHCNIAHMRYEMLGLSAEKGNRSNDA
jgi:radical SAM protein with 4Fe4S-binding SPASM domain